MATPPCPTYLVDLECSACHTRHDAFIAQGLCPACARPLLARYDLEKARAAMDSAAAADRPASLWRYREVLPARDEPVSLGEGWTPLVETRRLGRELGLEHLWVKDESLNPTGSFKARGLSVAVTMAQERGFRRLAIPTAGNAGLALAAYASAAGMAADVFCPADTPQPFVRATRLLGARVHTVPGLITDCARLVRERAAAEGWMDVSTCKEPYRVEGKKTMGYELWEQSGGRLPDVVVYPTGGGTGLIGMWKAFEELQALGRIGAERPRMISVQAEGCAPIVRAFHSGAETAEPWQDPVTVASGLRVPSAVGDRLMLAALRESCGTALTVSDAEMIEGAALLGRTEGILASPEGGAVVAAAGQLRQRGLVEARELIVLFNTGTALSYLDVMGR
jgi:threonine synthase